MGGAGSGRTKKSKADTAEAVGIARDAAPEMMRKLIDRARGGDKDAMIKCLEWGIGKPKQELAATIEKALIVFTAEEYAGFARIADHESMLLEAGDGGDIDLLAWGVDDDAQS